VRRLRLQKNGASNPLRPWSSTKFVRSTFPLRPRSATPSYNRNREFDLMISVSRKIQESYQLHPLLMQEGSQKPSPTRDKSQLEEQPSSSIVMIPPLIKLSAPPSSSAELFSIICDKQDSRLLDFYVTTLCAIAVCSSVLVTCTTTS
jgi:hypothetical protein